MASTQEEEEVVVSAFKLIPVKSVMHPCMTFGVRVRRVPWAACPPLPRRSALRHVSNESGGQRWIVGKLESAILGSRSHDRHRTPLGKGGQAAHATRRAFNAAKLPTG